MKQHIFNLCTFTTENRNGEVKSEQPGKKSLFYDEDLNKNRIFKLCKSGKLNNNQEKRSAREYRCQDYESLKIMSEP